tara:strand:- start:998 stop:1630 length:633 start_codon:yes stop_codon:yes gene_type:complete
MYKVFFKNKSLVLTTSNQIYSDSSILINSNSSNYSQIIKLLKSKKYKIIFYYNPSADKLIKHFEKCFTIIDAAGGLVMNKHYKYLLIYRNNKWDLPKGHLKKKELDLEGAAREVSEETGIKKLNPISILSTTYHFVKRDKLFKLKRTKWFLFSSSFKGDLKPQLEEGINRAEWKTKSEIKSIENEMYPNIKNLLNIHFDQSQTEFGTSDL